MPPKRRRRRFRHATGRFSQILQPGRAVIDLSKLSWRVKKKNAFLTRELIKAVNDENTEAVKKLIAAGADITVKSRGNNSLLFHCIQSQKESTAIALIDAGADVNATDCEGATIMTSALESASDKVLVRIIEAGADFKPSKKISMAHPRIRYMNHPYLSKNPVEIMALEGRAKVMSAFLKRGYKPNSRFKDGSTALIAAAKALTLDTCGECKQIDRQIRDRNGFVIKEINTTITVFDPEIKENYLETVRLLLSAGANPDLKDKSGKSAVDYVEDFEMKQLLTNTQTAQTSVLGF